LEELFFRRLVLEGPKFGGLLAY